MAFFLTFLLPVLLVILCNCIVFVVVIVILVKHTKGTLTRKNESVKTKTILRFLTSVMGVMFLFGISWLFAALTVTVQGIRLPAQVIFAIFNSLQGFFIFVFFCVLSREARESWKEVLSFGWYKSAYLNPSLKRAKNSKAGEAGSNGKPKGAPSTSNYVVKGTSSTALIVEKTESANLYSEPDTISRVEKVDLAKALENKGNVRLNGGTTHNSEMAEYSSIDEHGKNTPAAENNTTHVYTALVQSQGNNNEDDHHVYAHPEPVTTTTDSSVAQNEQAITIELHLQNGDFPGSDEPSEVKETALS